ncbi:MAG: hypothetical protein WKF84_04815 [Pyrinomonadaceae bacterium]
MVSSFFASVAYNWYIYYLVGYAVALRRLYVIHQRKSIETEAAIIAGGGQLVGKLQPLSGVFAEAQGVGVVVKK